MPASATLSSRGARTGQRVGTLTHVEVRSGADGGVHVEGHAAVFDVPAWIGPPDFGFQERIAPTAFRKTLKDQADVRFLFNHNPDLVLARTKSGTLSLDDRNATGLQVSADLAPTTVGRDLAVLLARGDVSQMSFGFQVVKDAWATVERDDGSAYDQRTILEAKLFDVSAVTYPAYDETDLAIREADLTRQLHRTSSRPSTEPRSRDRAVAAMDRILEARALDASQTATLTSLLTHLAAADAAFDPIVDAVCGADMALDEAQAALAALLGVGDPDPEDPEDMGDMADGPMPSGGAAGRSTPHSTSADAKPADATPSQDGPTPSARTEGTAVTLYDERARIWNKMKELRDQTNGRVMSGEEEASWQRMEADLDRATRSINIQERAAEYAKVLEAPGDAPVSTRSTEHQTAGIIDSAASGRTVDVSTGNIQRSYDYERAFEKYLRRGFDRMSGEDRDCLEREFRDLSVGTSSAGGYTVPPGFIQKLTDALKAYGGMLDVSNVINTESGQPLQWPSSDDTGNVGAILAENNAAAVQDVTFGTKTLSAYMYSSKQVRVSLQLLNDSAFPLDQWLPTKFAQRIGRAINAHFTNGTGGGTQPTGLVPNLTVGKTGATGQTLTVLYDDLVDLIHSVDPAYRQNARWMLSDSAIKVVRKLKDTQGHPLWEPSLQAGVPDSLLAYPVTINQDMPVMAANAKSIAFGDFRQAYIIRQVQGVQVLRLNERFADALQVGFLSFARYDGSPDDLNAAKLYQNSAT